MKLTIDRDVWIRGRDNEGSLLLRPSDGKRCCVGIYLGAVGVSDEALSDHGAVHCVTERLPLEAQWLLEPSTEDSSLSAYNLYAENDTNASEPTIARMFSEHGVEVEFVG